MIVLRKRCWSEDRNYSILGDIYRSGLKRSGRKYIGQLRRGIGNRLEASIRRNRINFRQAVNDINKYPIVKNSILDRKLMKESNNLGGKVTRLNPTNTGGKVIPAVEKNKLDLSNHYFNPTDKETIFFPEDALLKNYRRKVGMNLNQAIDSGKYSDIIFYPVGSGTETLAHEIGHLSNSKSKGIRRLINQTGNKDMGDFNHFIKNNWRDNSSGLLEAGKRFIKGKVLLAEESNASKYGRSIMKNLGASVKDIDQTKKIQDRFLDTYKNQVSAYWKSPLKNKIQIPSRRPKT